VELLAWSIVKICELDFLKKTIVIISLGAEAWVGIKKADLNDLAIIMWRAFHMLKKVSKINSIVLLGQGNEFIIGLDQGSLSDSLSFIPISIKHNNFLTEVNATGSIGIWHDESKPN
jgi:hypothetical protein